MSELTVLRSKDDASVNFVTPAEVGYFESRYVRRVPEYFSLYLSSQSGCRHGCRMCHLTATKQTQIVNATAHDLYDQARQVFKHYHGTLGPKANIVHYNFMARGETMANRTFLADSQTILRNLGEMALERQLIPRFLISTIMPHDIHGLRLANLFPLITPEIYYSIYSVRDEFRRKWLPNAMPVYDALHALREYQDTKRIIPKLHWAFIKGENDSEQDVADICYQVREFGLQANLAIVRYNPFDARYGEEPSEEIIHRNQRLMAELLPGARVKIVTRVGKDVKASCGMFVTPGDVKPAGNNLLIGTNRYNRHKEY